MSTDPVADPAAKVKRAAQHLEVLHADIQRFYNSDPRPVRFMTKVDEESSQFIARLSIDRPPAVELSLSCGDFVQNLRAALDHLVWQLVIANGKRPYRRNAFPIFKEPASSKPDAQARWDAMLRGTSDAAVGFVESCQPYHGNPDAHVLSALQGLSNEDKHRNLLSTVMAIEPDPGRIDLNVVAVRDVAAPERGQVFAGRPLNHMDLVVTAAVRITGPNPEVRMEGDLPLDVGFGWKPVPIGGLRQMVDAVAHVVAEARRLMRA